MYLFIQFIHVNVNNIAQNVVSIYIYCIIYSQIYITKKQVQGKFGERNYSQSDMWQQYLIYAISAGSNNHIAVVQYYQEKQIHVRYSVLNQAGFCLNFD